MSITPDTLTQFMTDELGIDTSDVTKSSPLFSSGVIDSFSLVTLISHIEQACGFRVGPSDVNLDNFDSIERITAYVARMNGDMQ